MNEAAVRKIFSAKARPADNPLIVHIADGADLPALCSYIPEKAKRLAEAFWPGPLTLVLPKREGIPHVVTAGLPTVAVRLPAHPAAREILRMSGLYLAAPSANRSGFPSPTTPEHVWQDMNGRIDAILDGGPCAWGVESTVVDVSVDPPVLLRPGGVTWEQLSEAVGPVLVDPAVKGQGADIPRAPGMKYRHYAPAARLIVLRGPADRAAAFISHKRETDKALAVLCPEEEETCFTGGPVFVYGSADRPQTLAQGLFAALRRLDEEGVCLAYVRCPEGMGVLQAVHNRLYKAAGFAFVDVGDDI